MRFGEMDQCHFTTRVVALKFIREPTPSLVAFRRDFVRAR